MDFKRVINLSELLNKKSFFLLGPRSTGKSYLIRQQLSSSALVFNLLKSDEYISLQQNPSQLAERIAAVSPAPKFIVIDEIQRVSELLMKFIG